jgi:predicted O-linked N-acetylglucosamine transferase (SPINDLY family)
MDDSSLQRAVSLHQSGNLTEAQALYRAIVKQDPKNFEGLYRLGISFAQQSKFDHAVKWIKRALALRPDFAQGHFDLGSLYGQLGRVALAVKSLERAIACNPDYGEAYHNLGNALNELGQSEEAIAAFDRAIVLTPAIASLYFNRANALKKLLRHSEAIDDYQKALVIEPDHVQALNNLGNCLYETKHFDEATEAFKRAIALNPDYASAHFNLANVQRQCGLWRDAGESLRRVIDIDPGYDYALGALVSLRMYCCDWDAVDRYVPQVIKGVRAGKPTIDPFTFLALNASPADQLICAQTGMRKECPPAPAAIWRGEKYRHDKIRIAYLQGDFSDHPMAHLTVGLFEHHDRSRFETTAIAFDAGKQTPLRQRMVDAFDHFIDVRQTSDQDVAKILRENEIDIAIDGKGYTQDARTNIFALRPAPVQVNYLAYPGTMGAPYMDYIIGDRFVIPPGDEKYYSEQVVRLPDTYLVNDSRRSIAETTPTRAEAGLPENGFVFCAFTNGYKITKPLFDCWLRLLTQVDGSVLWLPAGKNPIVLDNLCTAAEAHGLAPGRLVFADYTATNRGHLARLCLADLSLDTLPYGAHSTASDSLYVGTPIITCRGTTFAGRVGAGLLSAVGLGELITETLDEYENLALKIARDPKFHTALKAKLARNIRTTALFDTARFTRHIEAAYQTMWERAQQGLSPKAFDVPALP